MDELANVAIEVFFMAAPATHYVKSDDVHIAYQVIGDGPLDLLFVPGFVSHIEATWQSPTRSSKRQTGRRRASCAGGHPSSSSVTSSECESIWRRRQRADSRRASEI
jgi:hypothetical protein